MKAASSPFLGDVCKTGLSEKDLKSNLYLLSPQLVAQGQFTIIKQPLGFIKVLQWVSSVFFGFIVNNNLDKIP